MWTNPYDAWLFLTGSTGEHEASGVGWLLTLKRSRFGRTTIGSTNGPSLRWVA